MKNLARITIFSLVFNSIFLQTYKFNASTAGILQIESTEIGKRGFKYVTKVTGENTVPNSCTVCVFEPPSKSERCCEHVSRSITSKGNCFTKEIIPLSPATEYQLNICDGNTKNKILSHLFVTKQIPKYKQMNYDDSTGIISYDVEYEKDDYIPINCKIQNKNNDNFNCLESTSCTCRTGKIKLLQNQKNDEIYLKDPFGESLFRFNRYGPTSDDPSIYKFRINEKGIDSLPYSMTFTDPTLNDESICSFTNTVDNSKLKCRGLYIITDKCICKGGTLVELKPSTRYNVRIQSDTNILYRNVSFKTARVGAKINHHIGMNKYKYTIMYRKEDDISVDECIVCLLQQTVRKQCCYRGKYSTSADNCNGREFTREEIDKVGSTDIKVNICDTRGNQIMTGNFSTASIYEKIEYTVTPAGLVYALKFQGDKTPNICKFKILPHESTTPIEPRCLDSINCECSSGTISYPKNLKGSAKLTITDYFDEEITTEDINFDTVDEIRMLPQFCKQNSVPEAPTRPTNVNPTDGTITTGENGGEINSPVVPNNNPTNVVIENDKPIGGPTPTVVDNTNPTVSTTETDISSTKPAGEPSIVEPPTTIGSNSDSIDKTPATAGGSNSDSTVETTNTGGSTTDAGTPTTDISNTGSNGGISTTGGGTNTPGGTSTTGGGTTDGGISTAGGSTTNSNGGTNSGTSTTDISNTDSNKGTSTTGDGTTDGGTSTTGGGTSKPGGTSTIGGGTTVTNGDAGNDKDNEENGKQKLSAAAIAGIVIFTLILGGSVCGVIYYLTQVKGKESDSPVARF